MKKRFFVMSILAGMFFLAATVTFGLWAAGVATLRWFLIVALVEIIFAGTIRRQLEAISGEVNT